MLNAVASGGIGKAFAPVETRCWRPKKGSAFASRKKHSLDSIQNSGSSALQCWMLCHQYFRCRRVRWCMHRTCRSATVPYKMDSGYLVNLPCSPGNRRDPISIKHRYWNVSKKSGPSICFHHQTYPPKSSKHPIISPLVWHESCRCVQRACGSLNATKAHGRREVWDLCLENPWKEETIR